MIQSKELRIGNWVSFVTDPNKYKDYHQITNTDEDGFLCHNGEVKCEFHPIPLSPDILERCGFDVNSANQWSLGKLSISLPGVNGYKNGRVYFNGWCIIEDFSPALHQLQNIYSDLNNGKELKITL